MVFELAGGRVPELTIERATPPLVADPSGQTLDVPGSWFVAIRLVYASGAGYSTEDGKPTYTGPDAFTPGYPRLTSLVESGDFEAVFSWYAGLTGPMCVHAYRLANPSRLVIDFRER